MREDVLAALSLDMPVEEHLAERVRRRRIRLMPAQDLLKGIACGDQLWGIQPVC